MYDVFHVQGVHVYDVFHVQGVRVYDVFHVQGVHVYDVFHVHVYDVFHVQVVDQRLPFRLREIPHVQTLGAALNWCGRIDRIHQPARGHRPT